MPSITIYIKDTEYVKLIKEENQSKLIQQLLKEYYEKQAEKLKETPSIESKTETLKTENSN
jgi:hypothetical protein